MHTSVEQPASFLSGTFKFEFAPALGMEFLNANGETENISLQDMIECDIKTEFDEHMAKVDGIGTQTNMLDHHSSFTLNDSAQVCLSSLNSHGSMDSSTKVNGDYSWLNTVSMDAIQQQLDPPENTDPNLLVNPSTGLPVTLASLTSAVDPPSSPITSSPATLNGQSLQTIIHSSNGNVQYIGFPTASLQQSQNYLQQVSPLQQVRQQLQYNQHSSLSGQVKQNKTLVRAEENKVYPKPLYSYSCLIAMALKNSETGCLPVSEIYSFMTENFPYFKTAPDGWKNSVRHNLSLNKCFEKIENPKSNGTTKKGCLWAMNPAKIEKMEEEIIK